ncbi:MAG: PAS domain-containing protein [Alphaproteobacteria bacterium]
MYEPESGASEGLSEPVFINSEEEAAQVLPKDPFHDLYAIWRGWDEAEDRVPFRRCLEPTDLTRFLSHMMLIERLPEGEFFYRVVGTHIVAAVGFDPTMKPMHELPEYVDTDAVTAAFQSALDRKRPRFELMTGRIFAKNWTTYRRLLLPMADDSGTVRFILGCVHGQATDP